MLEWNHDSVSGLSMAAIEPYHIIMGPVASGEFVYIIRNGVNKVAEGYTETQEHASAMALQFIKNDVMRLAIQLGLANIAWIPVAQQLPDCAKTVLVYINDGCNTITDADFDPVDGWKFIALGNAYISEELITHWRHMPPPPEGA